MIIDSHVHIGTIIDFNMPKEYVIASMEKYNIDYCIVSNGEAIEVDHTQKPIPSEQQKGQIEVNEEVLSFANENPGRIGVLLWIKPSTEGCTPEFEELIIKNRHNILGIKVHPYHSKMFFGSPKVEKYIELARKYSLPVVTHTAIDEESSPEEVYKVAQKFPEVNFVMAHLGLGSDNKRAIELVSKLPNLYGDTTWVSPENTLEAIRVCGIDKILFGTDSPIDGIDTYEKYSYYFNDMKNKLSKEDYEKLMYKNAVKLFNIKVLE